MTKLTFKLLTAPDIPPGLASLVGSSVIENDHMFDIPVHVSEDIPDGEVWMFATKDEDDAPCARFSNIVTLQDSLTCEVVFKYPLKTIGMVLSLDKEV